MKYFAFAFLKLLLFASLSDYLICWKLVKYFAFAFVFLKLLLFVIQITFVNHFAFQKLIRIGNHSGCLLSYGFVKR